MGIFSEHHPSQFLQGFFPRDPTACSNFKHNLVCSQVCKMSKAFCWPCCSGSRFLPDLRLGLLPWCPSSHTWGLSSGSGCVIKNAHLEAHVHLLRGLAPLQHPPPPASLLWIFQHSPFFPVLTHFELFLPCLNVGSLSAPTWPLVQ